LCLGYVLANKTESTLGRNRRRTNSSACQFEEDSTDIGSATSDADTSYSALSSPCCTDSEDVDLKSKDIGRSWLRQPHSKANRSSKFASTHLETIVGTPAGMSEHPPLFNVPLSAECSEADESQAETAKPHGFKPPPGLCSPQKSRRAKFTALLSTAPTPSRKQSVLATGAEQLVSESHVLPASPNRRARLAAIKQAQLEEAPLKVQMESEINLTKFLFMKDLLDPQEPVKKRPIFADSRELSNIDEPVKKRVTPWLLAEPECIAVTVAPVLPR